MRAIALLGGAVALASGEKKASSVLQTCINILNEMAAEGRKAMNEEKVAWAKRSQECKHNAQVMQEDITRGQTEARNLKTESGKQAGIIAAKTNVIDEQNQIIRDATAASKKNDEDRAAGKKQYQAEKSDLEDAIVGLGEAKRLLANEVKRQANAGKGESFLQSAAVPENVKAMVTSLLEQKGMKEAAAYESNMGMVIEMLEDEERSARKQLNDVELGEINAKNAHSMLKQDYANQIAAADRALQEATIAKDQAEADKASADEQLAQERLDIAADQKELSAWEKLCKEEGLSFDEKQQVRQDEITAVTKAVEILGKASISFAQKATSLLQLKDAGNGRAEAVKVSMFLSKQADKLQSKVLSLLSEKISADPFAKVTKMIEQMIAKLVKEGGEEAQKKMYCDTEIGKSTAALKRTQIEYDRAAGEFAKQSAAHVQLSEDAKILRQEISDLKAAMASATKDRNEEKAANEQEIATCEADVEAVTNALAVLREFYEKAGQATAFLQTRARGIKFGSAEWESLDDPNKPEDYVYGSGKGNDKGHTAGMATFGDTYSGQQDGATAVLAMLETVIEDVNEKRVEVQKSEAEAANSYDNFMQDSKVAVATKTTTADNHEGNAADAKKKSLSAKSEANAKGRQLDKLNEARAALLPTCPVWAGGTGGQPSFEERQQKRQEEIDALKMAHEMLSPQ